MKVPHGIQQTVHRNGNAREALTGDLKRSHGKIQSVVTSACMTERESSEHVKGTMTREAKISGREVRRQRETRELMNAQRRWTNQRTTP